MILGETQDKIEEKVMLITKSNNKINKPILYIETINYLIYSY